MELPTTPPTTAPVAVPIWRDVGLEAQPVRTTSDAAAAAIKSFDFISVTFV
jgi:hypothetical protein